MAAYLVHLGAITLAVFAVAAILLAVVSRARGRAVPLVLAALFFLGAGACCLLASWYR